MKFIKSFNNLTILIIILLELFCVSSCNKDTGIGINGLYVPADIQSKFRQTPELFYMSFAYEFKGSDIVDLIGFEASTKSKSGNHIYTFSGTPTVYLYSYDTKTYSYIRNGSTIVLSNGSILTYNDGCVYDNGEKLIRVSK